MDKRKTLHELCDELNVSRRAVQGYEKAGLVSAAGRNKYGHLLYDQNEQERIGLIRLYQQMGFSIKEIKILIDAPHDVKRDALGKQIKHLKEEQIRIGSVIERAYGQIKLMKDGGEENEQKNNE